MEIAMICGLFLGWKLTILVMFLSFLLGGVGGAVLIVTKKKKRKEPIAFGPFMAIAALIVILFGQDIINWYFSSFFMS